MFWVFLFQIGLVFLLICLLFCDHVFFWWCRLVELLRVFNIELLLQIMYGVHTFTTAVVNCIGPCLATLDFITFPVQPLLVLEQHLVTWAKGCGYVFLVIVVFLLFLGLCNLFCCLLADVQYLRKGCNHIIYQFLEVFLTQCGVYNSL